MKGIESPDFEKYKGREGAIKRSEFLDEMGRRMDDFLSRYRSGLEPEIIEKRSGNKKKILDMLGGTDDDWNTWQWQFKNVFKDKAGFEKIKQIIKLKPMEENAIVLALENNVPFGVTPYYLHLMDYEPNGIDFAIRRQVFPPMSYVKNMIIHNGDRGLAFDFMREHDTSPVDLVTRRYPRVAIIKPYDSCPQICVYCQRNWEITSPLMIQAMASKEKLDSAIDWFAEHEEMMDVLITGGDPLVMSDALINNILKRFSCSIRSKQLPLCCEWPHALVNEGPVFLR